MLVLALQIPFWVTAIIAALFLFVCVLLILAILIQRPAGGGPQRRLRLRRGFGPDRLRRQDRRCPHLGHHHHLLRLPSSSPSS